MSKGWRGESRRHSLSARGVSTKSYNPNMARWGSSNGRWNSGKSKTYYRRIAGCELNDGKIVHHVDHNVYNSDPSNLEVIEPKEDISARGIHSQQHPEKGYREPIKAFPRWVNKVRNQRGRDWRRWKFAVPNDKNRYTYTEMLSKLKTDNIKQVRSYYDDKYYDKIKFRVK